jgi:hypothetical protein
MTKPSDFKLNTDYLALAQVSGAEYVAVFPSETFPGGQAYDRTRDFILPAVKGAIDRILISCNGGDYTIGSAVVFSSKLRVFVYRPDASTIRIRLHEYNVSSGGYAMPMQTIKIKVSSFKPPNVF